MKHHSERPVHSISLGPEEFAALLDVDGVLLEPDNKGVAYLIQLEYETEEHLNQMAAEARALADKLEEEYENIQ